MFVPVGASHPSGSEASSGISSSAAARPGGSGRPMTVGPIDRRPAAVAEADVSKRDVDGKLTHTTRTTSPEPDLVASREKSAWSAFEPRTPGARVDTKIGGRRQFVMAQARGRE